jgi:electron transfer flavoprotein beta subunit
MKIAVCVNHVPDTEARIKISADGKTIDKTGITFILNPYDEIAVEQGLQLKEKFGGEVIAVSLGADSNKETLRKALAMGADKAVLIKDEAPRDSFAVAKAISDVLKDLNPDIILLGKQSIDYDNSQMPGLVGELLGLPSVSVVVKMQIENSKVTCEREIEGGHEKVETQLPAVISVQKGLCEPRYPSLKGIMASKTKPIEEKKASEVAAKVEVVSLRLPPAKQAGKVVGNDVTAVKELVRLLHEEAKVI